MVGDVKANPRDFYRYINSQTTASCCKRSKIGLGPSFVWCHTEHCRGSLLFSLYINDISTDIDSEIKLFADDCVCYRDIKDTEDTLKLQKDIDQLGCWARKWGMRFQRVKCNMMQITRNRIKQIHASYTLEGTVLENVESIKYFGVTITNDLRWNTHVSSICTKANRTLGFLRRNLYACPQDVKEAAYKGLVWPVLEYSGSFWDPSGVGLQNELETFKIERLVLTLSSWLGAAGIIILWHIRSPSLTLIFISVAFPSIPLGTGMHFQTLLSPLLKMPRMVLPSSLLW